MVEKNGCQIGILFVCCIAAILSGATLYLVAVRERDQASTTDQTDRVNSAVTEPNQRCQYSDDVAIIGAGISGSYAAWRLRRANKSITLYEYSNRIGGRCNTVKFPGIPDINVELGAMRFHPTSHIILNKTITDLGLEIIDFLPENTKTMYHLRGEHLSPEQLTRNPPYNLKPEHKKPSWQLQWEIFDNYTNVNSSVAGYTDPPLVLNYATPDGVPLYKQSFQSFYGKYLYPELAAFIEDIGGFSSSYRGASASRAIRYSDPDISLEARSAVKTVKEGFQAIPETMVKQFKETSNRHKFEPNHHLKSIRSVEDGLYKMTFQTTETIRGKTKDKIGESIQRCAKNVMLAIPRLALEHLDWNVLKDQVTEDYLKNSLYEAKAGKMYFAYEHPWWRNVVNFAPTVISNTPLRVTYDFGVSNSTGKAVLNPVYNDVYTEVWKNTLKQGKHVPGVGDDTIQNSDISQNMTRRFLAQIFGISESDVPQPNYSIGTESKFDKTINYTLQTGTKIAICTLCGKVMRIWDEYPFGAGWYRFRPGYLWNEVADYMMKPSTDDNVYIISNTFSSEEKQSWTEGALEIVDSMIMKYFPKFYNL